MIETIMLDAYLGIASPVGLDALVEDHPHTRRFLSRKIRRCHDRPICGLWIVLSREVAEDATRLLAMGERLEALRLVENNARDIGVLIPESTRWDADLFC